jgi:class 3 adenylate cyclase
MSEATALECTAMMVDIRGFTTTLQKATRNEPKDGASRFRNFVDFLDRFYDACVVVAETLSPDPNRLYVNSTGDGIAALFLDPECHAQQAFLTGIVLAHGLSALFDRYADLFPLRARAPDGYRVNQFGIGMDSGTVREVATTRSQAKLKTYIGNPLNIASRLESYTSTLHRTRMVVGSNTVNLLTNGQYERLYWPALAAIDDPNRARKMFDLLNTFDADLGLKYLNELYLRGVDEPVKVFRLSPSLIGVESLVSVVRRISPELEESFHLAISRMTAVATQ